MRYRDKNIVVVLPLLLAIVMGLVSCCKKKVYCQDGVLQFSFTGFDRNEVRGFTLRRYEKNNEFDKVIDSAQYIYTAAAPVRTIPDTISINDYRTVSSIRGITVENDWAIYLPAINKVFYITNISDDGNESQLVRCGDEKTHCESAITNLYINSVWLGSNSIFIEKGKY